MHLLENLKKFAKTDKMVAINETERLSYAQLWENSEAFAAYMKKHCDDKSPVIIIGDKQNEILSFFFGAIKSCHPYVFVPSHYPVNRILEILKDCGAKTIISFDEENARLENENATCIDMSENSAFENEFKEFMGHSVSVDDYATNDDLWTIFYTSGSTGTPKGVQLSGKNINAKVDLVRCLDKYYIETTIDILNLSSYAFSISITTLFYSVVMHGATLHAVPKTLLGNYSALFDFMLEINPSLITATPSFLEICLKNPKFSSEHFDRCRYICFGGEVLPKPVFQAVKKRFFNAELHNGYGTTESTAAPFITYLDDKILENCDTDIMPVGYDDGSLGTLKIIDDDGNILPDGEIGEFVVEGDYVSEGYCNRPELSEKVFYTAPNGKRGYHTNDLMYRKNNCFFYCGRKDNLVKVGGYRVELEDVEHNLRKIDIIRSCAVVPVMQDSSVIMLAAYVVLNENDKSKLASIQYIKKQLSVLVQNYMIPQKIVILDELPRNNSGKTDRVKLKEMASIKRDI